MSMYYDKVCYKDVPEKDLWVLLLLGNYALNKLLETYEKSKDTKLTYNLTYYCHDRRRTPTVRKHLQKLNLIASPVFSDLNARPVEDEIEKLLPGSMKEPAFETTGIITKRRNYYSEETKILQEKGEAYRAIVDLNAYEVIYVYLHQKDFDIREFKHTVTYRHVRKYRTESLDTYTVKVFPKRSIDPLDEGILWETVKKYAASHGKEILSSVFKFNLIEMSDTLPYFTKEDLKKRSAMLRDKIASLSRVEIEINAILRESEGISDQQYTDKILSGSRQYIEDQSPVWILEEDPEKKHLATMILKGIDTITETKCNN